MSTSKEISSENAAASLKKKTIKKEGSSPLKSASAKRSKRSSVKKTASRKATQKKAAVKRIPARKLDLEKETSATPSRSTEKIVRTRTDLPEAIERAKMAAKIIAENKGTDIKILDLREITQAFDFFVIASGASRRQLHAISDEIDDVFEKKLKDTRRGINGYQESRWIVLDYNDIVIHLFDPDIRDFYALEELWGKGTIIPF